MSESADDDATGTFDICLHFDWGEKEFAHWRSIGAGSPRRPGEVILVVQRDDGGVLLHTKAFYPSGAWRILTGGIDGDEQPEEAFRRELTEETGFAAGQPHYLGRLRYTFAHAGDRIDFASYAYLIDVDASAVPRPGDGGEQITAFRWASPESLREVASELRNLEGEWSDWGKFRAAAHDEVAAALESLSREP